MNPPAESEKDVSGSNLLKTLLGIIVIGIVVALIVTIATPASSHSSAINKTRTITDMAGKTVEIPVNISRIVITCCGGATNEVMVLGGADKIVSQPPTCIMPLQKIIFPGFNNLPDPGLNANMNVEQVFALHPDIAITSITTETQNAKLSQGSIPVVSVLTGKGNLSALKNEFAMMGKVLGNEEKSDKLLAYWDISLNRNQERVSAIPQNQRKKVYYMNSKMGSSEGKGYWGQDLIVSAGGINVAEDKGSSQDITVEQIIAWDPDVIIGRNQGGFLVDSVKKDPKLSGVSAVKNNQVYICPTGAFWWDRPSPESPLGILWLAKTLYPEKFSDIDLKDETQEFYRTFYGYSLSDDEYEKFFLPDSSSAK